MIKALYFDMDGTIANLYKQYGWLDDLANEKVRPYINAEPMVNMVWLARRLNALQKRGYIIGIISWNCKNATEAYAEEVAKAKMRWLAKHLPSVQFDEIHIVPYGTPKYEVAEVKEAILFDDELQNLLEWGGEPILANAIDETLKHLLTNF